MDIKTDVLVVGGGPVGIIIAYQLARTGISVHLIDKDPKDGQTTIGRANVIYPRPAELLDQLGLAEELVQVANLCRESYTYKDGKPVIPGRIWNFVENIDDTFFDFAIMLRQQFTEAILRKKLQGVGCRLYTQRECVSLETRTPDAEGFAATAKIADLATGSKYTVECKYVVGADGGRSAIRRFTGVTFEGDQTEDKWIRIDGLIKTNLPTADSYGSIESPTHGNVLWAPLDQGISRIGYVFTKEQEEKCGGNVTEEVAVREAIAAMRPFTVEFERVEWWTLYIIGQRVASTFQPGDRILLAGDAAHTHSSGAAQGLNTGIHDATNLGWKLSMVILGFAYPDILRTYNTERRAAAQRLIAFDRKIAGLVAGKLPDTFEPDAGVDTNELLAKLFNDASALNTGLGISYERNVLNHVTEKSLIHCLILPGMRAPDIQLLKPGTHDPARLQQLTPNLAKFYVVVFAGDSRSTRLRIASFGQYLESKTSFTKTIPSGVVEVITISTQEANSVLIALGHQSFGPCYYDKDRSAHKRYGVDVKIGAVLVLRPDGIVGISAELSACGGSDVTGYLQCIIPCN
ncbi:hypothetical protein B7463_g7580, partial [Scytalidium lignicola]